MAAEPWYRRAFTASYLSRYLHRSDEAADAEIDFLLRATGLPAGARVLDLGCGGGRHARALARRGCRVVGVDLSAELLQAARRANGRLKIEYCCADMRDLPLGAGRFDAVFSLFTSFGYFQSDAENARVPQGVARVLRPGGWYVLDFFNRAATLRGLVPHSVKPTPAGPLLEWRRFRSRSARLEKIAVTRTAHGPERVLESVRAYAPRELEALLATSGLRTLERFGTLAGAPFDACRSPRCVLIARKAAPA